MTERSRREFLKDSMTAFPVLLGSGRMASAVLGLAGTASWAGEKHQGWQASLEVIARLEERARRRNRQVTYREEQVPAYSLPNPLVMNDGLRVSDPVTWVEKRRPEILELFRRHVYGRAPVGRPDGMTFEPGAIDARALDGRATRKDLAVNFTGLPTGPRMDMRVYTPTQASGPAPCFLYLGRPMPSDAPLHERLVEALPEIISRGYALAVIDREGIDPDEDDGFANGVHGVYDSPGERPGDAWGTISAWAWGLSRALDYLETDDDVDAGRVAVMGVSRAGKTALWAGAQDERFTMTISVNSGCTGAALSRRRFGETLEAINDRFPHWFCRNYRQFNGREGALPVDQHMLLALLAPRLAYVSSADEDLWADPRGEFLGALNANPVYRMLGARGMEAKHMPALEHPVQAGRIGYHIRRGGHGLEHYDWLRYLDFADRHLK